MRDQTSGLKTRLRFGFIVMTFFTVAAPALLCTPARGQTLVFSTTYTETRASFQARFANASPAPGLRTDDQNIAMVRGTRKTEIDSISLADGKRSLLFSDEGSHLEIGAAASVAGGSKAYTRATWRYFATVPVSPANSAPYRGLKSDEGIYELSLDGSNQFRRIADAPKAGPLVLNPQGTRAAAETSDGESLLIYSLPDWKLLNTVSLPKLARAHCPDCTPASFGWLADGNLLYLELVVVGDEDDNEAKLDHPGVYVVSADGADLGMFPDSVGGFAVPGYVHPKFIERRLLGQLPDGRYLFLDYGVKQDNPPAKAEPFIVIASADAAAADSKSQKAFPLRFSIGGCYISPSGKYIAYLESRRTPDYRSEQHLWVKNLESGEEKEIFSVPAPNPPTSPEPNLAISILGWLN